MRLIFNCREDNDLYKVLVSRGEKPLRFETLENSIEVAPKGAGVLAFADDYPGKRVEVNPHLLDEAQEKDLRLYLEYPLLLPDIELRSPRETKWERALVGSDFFSPELVRLRILTLHQCWFLPNQAKSPHLVIARVAGYDEAAFGPPEETFPLLFDYPGRAILVATSKLSQFVTGRYGPTLAWKVIWERLLRWLARTDDIPEICWTPTVRVHFGPTEKLSPTAESDTFRQSVNWFRESALYGSSRSKNLVIEGYASAIDHQGRQMRQTKFKSRSDCAAETAMVFACDWAVTRNRESFLLARQILDNVWSAPDYWQGDPQSPAYGLSNWYEQGAFFYGDDNARVILATLAAGRLLDEARWDEYVLRCLLANLRTTGPLGFRRNRINLSDFFEGNRGWEYFHDTPVVTYSPHYQAYLWACYLWAYALTGYEGFLSRSQKAIRMTMDAYPKWKWTNGLTQEMARMLLPLAFLVRIEDTTEHRGWIDRIAEDLLAQQQPCGAIRELLGKPAEGESPPPSSNQEYGTREASVIQKNGDPACDLLYTANFAFLGLHEAFAATGEARLRRAEDKLAEFFCRIQVRSTVHPYLEGCWMRSFDYEKWEYWGSSADTGWGAWCVESGWTNSWIAATFAMRLLGETLFDLSVADRLKERFPALLSEMLRGKG